MQRINCHSSLYDISCIDIRQTLSGKSFDKRKCVYFVLTLFGQKYSYSIRIVLSKKYSHCRRHRVYAVVYIDCRGKDIFTCSERHSYKAPNVFVVYRSRRLSFLPNINNYYCAQRFQRYENISNLLCTYVYIL